MGTAPCIMGFAGHMIDSDDREVPRFPRSAESQVRFAIRDCINRYQPQIAVSSAACGGDIIFAEETIALGIPTYIILPFEDQEEFINHSVYFAKDNWVERFYEVIKAAKQVFYVNPRGFESNKDFEENQHAIIFFSLGIQQNLNFQIVNLILYDDKAPGDGPGGTQSFLDLCEGLERLGLNLVHEMLDMGKIRDQANS
jgi:hypothetical protein